MERMETGHPDLNYVSAAAMTAYGKLQFQEMSAEERAAVESALLK
jgi:hypothetical protein